MVKIILILFAALCGNVLAQEIDDIATDRPDQTETSNTVPCGFLQVELGFTYERDVVDNSVPSISLTRTLASEVYSPAILLRYGISSNVELRLSGEYIRQKWTSKISSYSVSFSENGRVYDFGPIGLGTKIMLFDEKKARPETALIFSLDIPWDTKSPYQPNYVSPSFRFSCSHTLSDRFSLGYNLGGEWENNRDNSTSTGIYTLTVGADIINKLGGYVELYGFLTQDEKPDHRFDAGLTYLIRKNIQLDVSGGVGITEISPDYFIGAGLSFRIPR